MKRTPMNKAMRPPKSHNMPTPAKNLGTHLRMPRQHEIVTEHRWADRKKAQA